MSVCGRVSVCMCVYVCLFVYIFNIYKPYYISFTYIGFWMLLFLFLLERFEKESHIHLNFDQFCVDPPRKLAKS